jgi:hypothetical protein
MEATSVIYSAYDLQPVKAGLLESSFPDAIPGYKLTVQVKDENYIASATPVRRDPSQSAYFTTADGILRSADTGEPLR